MTAVADICRATVHPFALVAAEPQKFFTSRHFAGQPAILVCLAAVATDELSAPLSEPWLLRAPSSFTRGRQV